MRLLRSILDEPFDESLADDSHVEHELSEEKLLLLSSIVLSENESRLKEKNQNKNLRFWINFG